MKARPCLDCGRLVPGSIRCTPCTQRRDRERGSSTQRGYGAEYRRARAALLADHPPCRWCGGVATTADHLVPLVRGGGVEGNLVPACQRCNSGRGRA